MIIQKVPTFIINLQSRLDRKQKILNEFFGREEFDYTVIKAEEHAVGAVGLWQSIKLIVKKAEREDHDFILICEDDHQFTKNYSKEFLLHCISKAKLAEAEILLGGVSWFKGAAPLPNNFFWVEIFTGAQFMIIFKSFYKKLLRAKFNSIDAADFKISELSKKKLILFPFISTQVDYGYSDVTAQNNKKGRIQKLFKDSSIALESLITVHHFYRKHLPSIEVYPRKFNIPTYVINLPERKDRLLHIKEQFKNKDEFDVKIIEGCKNKIGNLGLWQSLRKVVRLAKSNDDDVIVICEDDHEFTQHYSKAYLIKSILQAHQQNADIISGGASDFKNAIPLASRRFWADQILATQFIVVFKKFFDVILNEGFNKTVVVDLKLSKMTANKMIVYPFISTQRDFGYSDVTAVHNLHKGLVQQMFSRSAKRLRTLKKSYTKCQILMSDSFVQLSY